jgi:DNA-binding GntR family transcriptional regulator
LEKMAEHLDAMFNRSASGDNNPEFLYAVHSYHLEFHLKIAECTGCRALRRAIEKSHVLTFNWLYDIAARRPPLPPHFHRDLIEATSKGNIEEADHAMRKHVRYGLENILRTIGSNNAGPNSPIRRVK